VVHAFTVSAVRRRGAAARGRRPERRSGKIVTMRISSPAWRACVTTVVIVDEHTPQPRGRSRVAKPPAAAPVFVADAVSAHGFQRR
jgi:hypothetical protein